MSESNNPFIGNSTLLEALLNEYTKQFKEYSGKDIKVTLTPKQHSALKEISRAVSDEFCAMMFGVEVIGHLLKVADYENKGVDNEQLEQLGWFLSHLASSLNSHWSMMECMADDLANFSVSY